LAPTWDTRYWHASDALDRDRSGPVLAGRPAPWLILQLLAVGAVVAGTLTAVQWWRGRRHGIGRAAPTVLAGTALFLPWALYWGLLVP
jgi:hypothetical protein